VIRTRLKMAGFGRIWGGSSPGKAMHNKLTRYWPMSPISQRQFHCWISEWHWAPLTVLGILLLLVGGLPYLLWGTFFRTVFGLSLDVACKLSDAHVGLTAFHDGR